MANVCKPLDSTDLDIAHPSVYTIFLALDVHHTRSTAVAQQDVDIVERGCLLELGHFLPRSDVMRPDQRVMEALHRFSKANYAVVRGQTPTHICTTATSSLLTIAARGRYGSLARSRDASELDSTTMITSFAHRACTAQHMAKRNAYRLFSMRPSICSTAGCGAISVSHAQGGLPLHVSAAIPHENRSVGVAN